MPIKRSENELFRVLGIDDVEAAPVCCRRGRGERAQSVIEEGGRVREITGKERGLDLCDIYERVCVECARGGIYQT